MQFLFYTQGQGVEPQKLTNVHPSIKDREPITAEEFEEILQAAKNITSEFFRSKLPKYGRLHLGVSSYHSKSSAICFWVSHMFSCSNLTAMDILPSAVSSTFERKTIGCTSFQFEIRLSWSRTILKESVSSSNFTNTKEVSSLTIAHKFPYREVSLRASS